MERVLKDYLAGQPDALRTAAKFATDATVDANGIIRWNSNKRVPPSEYVELAAHIDSRVNVAASTAARDAELTAFLTDYRRNYKGPSDEERAEARAAHGPGVKLVNVITGTSFIT